MAGRGPAPKVNAIRRNAKNAAGFEQIVAQPVPQPNLPVVWMTEFVYDERLDTYVAKKKRLTWSAPTKAWWKMWGESPLMVDATADDWSFLTDTALLHNAYWSGDLKVAAELRLRVAKFGATPEDRLKLRKQFAPPPTDGDDEKTKATGSRARRGGLFAV